MTYFHIDQSQRYVQSLGYTGTRGIQERSIPVDSDGANGADNSFFELGGNRIMFGHGGVDDNEDADVILHEYFHALQFDINNNWSGGDTGAMGEGFCDYWAASYSYTTSNGSTFHPAWAFAWDGHSASTWPGRFLNLSPDSAQYDPKNTYPAHAMVGGVNGDELWGTPLFQAFLELIKAGVPREEIDTLMLEANFGLGANLTMREMAAVIVATAERVYPTGPHAAVFFDQFQAYGILPPFLSSSGLRVDGSPGTILSGRNVLLLLPLKANLYDCTNVSALLTSTQDGIHINQATSSYPSIATGDTANNGTKFSFTVSESQVSCGDILKFVVEVSFTSKGETKKQNIPLTLRVGTPQTRSFSSSPGLAIPDNDQNGIQTKLTISGTNTTVSENINIDMNISHTYRGDVALTLQSPAHTRVYLQVPSDDDSEDIIGNYPNTLNPAQGLDAFRGEPFDGVWTLWAADTYEEDTGTVNSWGVNDVYYTCETGNSSSDLHIGSLLLLLNDEDGEGKDKQNK